METNSRLVGTSVRRIEDHRFVTGEGHYLEDLRLDGMAVAVLWRSPYAHARIRSIDVSRAREQPGVLAVAAADDLSGIGPVPVGGSINNPDNVVLARGKVKFVGDPVVAVVAENAALAQDALDAIEVDFEPLDAVVDPYEALADGAPLVHDELESNVVMTAARETEHVDAEFDAAERRISVRVGHGRVAALPMETRGGIGVYDPDSDSYTLHLSTQAVWLERGDIAAALGVEEDKVRVVAPDVGGAFGGKMTPYRESILLLALAKRVGRPVRWIATRMEDLLSSMHGREAFTDGEVAFDNNGVIRALRLRTVANLGSYLMKYTAGPPMRMLLFPTGAYGIREFRSEVIGVFTNTGPMGPYRGAGRPEAAYFIERVVSDVANELGMDQAEIRRRNFIPADAFPYTNPANVTYDTGNYELALDRALELIDYPYVLHEIEQRRALGEVVGIGVASCVEVSGGGGENGLVTLREDGSVVAITGTSPHGQGLATSFAQIISDELGVPFEAVEVRHGDTAEGPRGGGTMGSRSLQLGGSALLEAAREIRKELQATVALELEVAPEDVTVAGQRFIVQGVPERSMSIPDAVKAYARRNPERANGGIAAEARFPGAGETFPFGTTIAVVSIDRATGHVTVERYVSVDDCGNVVNPRLVEGQLIGGAVQGIGETLWEQVAYDADGQLLASTMMNYAVPRAKWLPSFELDRTTTPTDRNPLGVKGVGEAGTVHAPPAVANAVMDALRPFGVEPLDLPLHAEKLWRVMEFGGAGIR